MGLLPESPSPSEVSRRAQGDAVVPGIEQLVGDAFALQNRADKIARQPFVAGRVGGIDAQELADQVEGVNHLLSLGFVDRARVGVNGWSYGGFMTLYSLFNAPGTFSAGIAGAPVTDWRQYDTIYTERYLGLPQQNEDGYKASSPVYEAAKVKGKLMLVHNFEDDNVLFQHSLRMADALQKAGKPFEFMLYPQKTHGVGGSVRRHMLEAMTSFWERNLLSPTP